MLYSFLFFLCTYILGFPVDEYSIKTVLSTVNLVVKQEKLILINFQSGRETNKEKPDLAKIENTIIELRI